MRVARKRSPRAAAFVTDIERQYGNRLRRFLASRLRDGAADVPDLAQEVFLRLLRIAHHDSIRSSEAYVFTVAFHVLHQHLQRRAKMLETVDFTGVIDDMESSSDTDPATQVETQQRLAIIQNALEKLSPTVGAVLMLHRRDGFSLQEIGTQLGISRTRAKKYFSQALVHCRKHLQ